MTNEEAIRWLDAIKKYYIHGGDEAYDKKRMKAIDKAIEALEQQPMRDATEEERKSVKDYIESISKPTGVQFETQSTDVVNCNWTTEEIAKSFIEDVEAVKDQLDGQSIDAVSREAVLHLYKTFWRCFVDDENADIFMNAIRDLPPVTPQRPKGKWIEYCYQNLNCSNCGYVVADTDIDEYNFCPNCGAEMGGAET